jgi:tRNA(fMet)-specific endonuclease VapC
MTYLLDTDTLIFMVRGLKLSAPRTEREQQRLQLGRHIVAQCQRRHAGGDEIGLSAITVSELEFGARNSAHYEREIAAVRKVLAPFVAYDFDATRAAMHYGELRHTLETAGSTIGAMDLLIASHARALGAVLVTNNTAHFKRVSGLACENWCAPA